jgi:hypothetical protein
MAYDPPTLAELQTKLRRDLRDPGPTDFTFTGDMLMDYANEGIVELNRVKPIEVVAEATDLAGLVNTGMTDVWSVEMLSPDGSIQTLLPPADGVVTKDGWMFYGGDIILGNRLRSQALSAFDTLMGWRMRFFGYRNREVFDGTPEQAAEFDAEDEACVRRYARFAGFKALANDRSLFQQWQTMANNSDVSPTQLMGMVSTAEGEWDLVRRKTIRIRRAPVGQR